MNRLTSIMVKNAVSEVNTERIQVLKSFVDFRGNLYAPGIYEPGTMPVNSLKRAKYKVLEEGQEAEPDTDKELTTTTQKKTIREVNPKLTMPVEEKPEATTNDLTKKVERKPRMTRAKKTE